MKKEKQEIEVMSDEEFEKLVLESIPEENRHLDYIPGEYFDGDDEDYYTEMDFILQEEERRHAIQEEIEKEKKNKNFKDFFILREKREYLDNYIIELRVYQDIYNFLDFVEENVEHFYTYRGLTFPKAKAKELFKNSIKLAREKAKISNPDSAIAIITEAGVTLILGEEEKYFFRDFYRPKLKCNYKVFRSFKEFLSLTNQESIKYKIDRIGGMLYYLNEEGKIISEETFNTYKKILQKFDGRGYGTDPKVIGNANIKDMRIMKNLCTSYSIYHGLSLEEIVDVYNNDDLELLD